MRARGHRVVAGVAADQAAVVAAFLAGARLAAAFFAGALAAAFLAGAFAAAWAELTRGKAKTAGAFRSAIPKPNLAKAGVPA